MRNATQKASVRPATRGKVLLRALYPHVEREYISPTEFAVRFDICLATVYNLASRGQLQMVKIGRTSRIAQSEVERFAAEAARKGALADA